METSIHWQHHCGKKLFKVGLVDRFRLMVFPVILGDPGQAHCGSAPQAFISQLGLHKRVGSRCAAGGIIFRPNRRYERKSPCRPSVGVDSEKKFFREELLNWKNKGLAF
jgi:hypothetical protein